mgnify:CR=1 FL=1
MIPIKLLSLFSGIGAFERALENLEIPYDLLGFCDIDKWAGKAYPILHNCSEDLNLKDVTTIDTSKYKDVDLLTYGFPCQDISLSGKMAGCKEGTRSGLVWTAHKIIKETKPKIAICENVKNLTSKKFAKEFKAILDNLEAMGYNNQWAILDAADYGVPQHRERVFIVSIRKDIDKGSFKFPEKQPLKKRLRDVLEKDVDEKYYLSDLQISRILQWKAQQKPFERVLGKGSVSPTLTARGAGEYHSGMILVNENMEETKSMQNELTNRIITLGNYSPSNHDASRVVSPDGIAPTVKENHGTTTTAVMEDKDILNTIRVGGRGSLDKNHSWDIVPSPIDNRPRKLTPNECFMLMGFTKEDCEKLAAAGISSTQLYKLAGNSIVVDVLENIYKELYYEKEKE